MSDLRIKLWLEKNWIVLSAKKSHYSFNLRIVSPKSEERELLGIIENNIITSASQMINLIKL